MSSKTRNMTRTSRRASRGGNRRQQGGRGRGRNPAPAYAGEQTYRHTFQAVYNLASSTPGGLVEFVNLGTIDDYTELTTAWALWRLVSFRLKLTPAAATNGAFAVRPFEAISATPVAPTDLGAVLIGGGKMKPCTTNSNNTITVSWRNKTTAATIFMPTSSLSNGDFGDPGWVFFCQGGSTDAPFNFWGELTAVYEFRDFNQEAMLARRTKQLTIVAAPVLQEQESFEEVHTPQPITRPIIKRVVRAAQ